MPQPPADSLPRRFIVASCVAGGLLFLAGCGRILGLDNYSPTGTTKHDASVAPIADAPAGDAEARTLFDPKLPYLTGDCEACLTEHCANEDAACSADADAECAAWLADARAKPDPGSAFTRFLQVNAARWDAEHEHDGGLSTVPAIALRNCARNSCTAECELGRDFSCFGDFSWPQSFPVDTDIRFRFAHSLIPTIVWKGFDVRACIDPACAAPLGQTKTDEHGFADLAIHHGMMTLSQYPEFDGFFLIDGGPTSADGGATFYPLVAESSRPWVTGNYGYVLHVPIDIMGPYIERLGKAYDPAMAYYGVQPFDCREEPAKGVTLELQVLEGTTFQPCDDCSVYYSDDLSRPDATFHSFSSLGQVAYVRGPARQSLLVVRDEKTRRAIAAVSPVSLAGHFHNVSVYPPSSAQVAAFPRDPL